MNPATNAQVVYETKTVRAVRGREAQTISKWEKDGWELVSRDPKALQTLITLRRPKAKSRTLLYVVGGVAVGVILATVITIGTINEKGAEPESAAPIATSRGPVPESVSPSNASPSAAPSPSTFPAVITAGNDPEFAALLALTDYCDPSIGEFAAKHRGQEVAFNGNVGAIAQHGDTSTRFDILVGAGDFSEAAQPGPFFQFRDVNTTSDLHYVGATPDALKAGQNVTVTAEVVEYEESSCLFLLDPTETSFR